MCGPYENFDFTGFLKDQWAKALERIDHYHVHIYFEEDTFGRGKLAAETLAAGLTGLFPDETKGPYSVGRVGPHTRPNIEVALKASAFGKAVQYLQMNAQGLSVLVHPRTGDEIADHKAAIWMGEPVAFNEAFFDNIRAATGRKPPKLG